MKRQIMLLILLGIIALSFLGKVDALVSVTHEFTIHAYNPCRVMINFAYADNVTHSDVYAANKSIWRLETSPISVTFSTDAIDVFYFSITIWYNIQTNQTLLIGVYSGSQQVANEYRLNLDCHTATLKFKVITGKEPSFPTAEEYAQIVLQRLPTRQDYSEFINWAKHQAEIQNTNLIYMWIIVAIVAVSAIANTATMLLIWRKTG